MHPHLRREEEKVMLCIAELLNSYFFNLTRRDAFVFTVTQMFYCVKSSK